jgi:hypothetical protein
MFERLEKECQSFDWYYAFSDDHRVWLSGESRREKLKNLIEDCKVIDPQKTKEIVLKYQHDCGCIFYHEEVKE